MECTSDSNRLVCRPSISSIAGRGPAVAPHPEDIFSSCQPDVKLQIARAGSLASVSVFSLKAQGRKIGAGSYGAVSAVEVPFDQELLSLAGLPSDLPSMKAAMKVAHARCKAFYREEEVLNALKGSKYIVQLYGSQDNEESPALFMELLQKFNLSNWLRYMRVNRMALTTRKIATLAHQLSEGLQAMHTRGYLHCDVKLENIGFKRTQRVIKLFDMGVAKRINEVAAGCGTRGFWALEVEEACHSHIAITYTPAVDWWSFGIVLVHMLLSSRPDFDHVMPKMLHLIYSKSCHVQEELQYASKGHPWLVALAAQLLQVDPYIRAGYAQVRYVLDAVSAGRVVKEKLRGQVEQPVVSPVSEERRIEGIDAAEEVAVNAGPPNRMWRCCELEERWMVEAQEAGGQVLIEKDQQKATKDVSCIGALPQLQGVGMQVQKQAATNSQLAAAQLAGLKGALKLTAAAGCGAVVGGVGGMLRPACTRAL